MKKKMTEMAKLQWTTRESYKVNNRLSRETKLCLNIQLSLLSQSMKDVFISIPITSLRFISITWPRSLEPANCSTKQCQWHFKGSQRVFDGILMLSGFGGISEESMVSGRLWSQATMTEATYPSQHPHPPHTHFLSGSGLNNCAQHGLGSPKSLTDDSRGEAGCLSEAQLFPQVLTFKFFSTQTVPRSCWMRQKWTHHLIQFNKCNK